MTDFKQLMADAMAEAESILPLRDLAPHLGMKVAGKSKKFWADPCPGCGKLHKFSLEPTGWGCFSSSCAHHNDPQAWEYRGATKMIEEFKGVDWKEARNIYLELANVPNPYESDEYKEVIKKAEKKKERANAAKSDTPKKDKPAAKSPTPKPPTKEEKKTPPPAPKISSPTGEITSQNIWSKIHECLILSPAHRESLKNDRGLDDATIDHFKFRSSLRQNRGNLEWIHDSLPEEELLELGILSFKKSGDHKLSAQLCGAPSTDEQEKWFDRNPVIIPYLDVTEKISWLRPHKLGLSPKEYLIEMKAREAFKQYQSNAHPFLALEHPNPLPYFSNKAVIVESEFKAAALWQLGIPAIALPGISMLRSKPFLKEFIKLVRSFRINHLIIAFDNDDKSDKPDPWDRHDTEVYAAYTCHVLRTEGFFMQIARIPDEWREHGKADWDGMLAKIQRDNPGKEHNPIAIKIFSKILQDSTYSEIQGDLLQEDEKTRIINCKLRRLTHEPNVKTGGSKEERDAVLIRKCHPDFSQKLQARKLADTLFEAQGCYFLPKPTPKEALPKFYALKKEIEEALEGSNLIEGVDGKVDTETKTSLIAALKACEYCINGRPDIISNFTLQCDYTIVSQEGDIERLVQLKSKNGELSAYQRPPNKAFTGPSDFKNFCLNAGNYAWTAGGNALDLLILDITQLSAWRQIRDLPYIGYNPDAKLWIFGDCAITNKGKFLFTDCSDIIWHEGIGYRIDPEDIKSKAMRSVPKFFRAYKTEEQGFTPQENHDNIDWELEKEECSQIFKDLLRLSNASFGDLSGWLALSTLIAYIYSPEILKKFKGHPGLWVTGRMSSGKTLTVKMLMRLFGYEDYSETNISKGTTVPYTDNTLASYSHIGIHFDEFRENECDEGKQSSIRNTYNRAAKGKGTINARRSTRNVTPRTTPIITGETIVTDPATRSRFFQCTMSKETRLPLGDGDMHSRNFNEFQTLSKQLPRLTRYLMRTRSEDAEDIITEMGKFVRAKDVCDAISVDRGRVVYGSAFCTLQKVFSHFSPINEPDLQRIREFTIRHADESNQDTVNVNFTNQFWSDVSNLMMTNHESGKHYRIECWGYEADGSIRKDMPFTDGDIPKGSFLVLIMNPKVIFDLYEKERRQRGKNAVMPLENLRTEIRKDPYWLSPPKDAATRSWKFSLSKRQVVCWVVRIDKMEEELANAFTGIGLSTTED
jgi:hypothetical protein